MVSVASGSTVKGKKAASSTIKKANSASKSHGRGAEEAGAKRKRLVEDDHGGKGKDGASTKLAVNGTDKSRVATPTKQKAGKNGTASPAPDAKRRKGPAGAATKKVEAWGDVSESESEDASSPPQDLSKLATPSGAGLALENFRLSESTLSALRQRDVKALFPIQAATFDLIYDGNDLIGRAHTGQGKTLAFALPTIERIHALTASEPQLLRPRQAIALVMTPTRELALQVAREIEGVASSLRVLCVYGGAPIHTQISTLSKGVSVLVGTPGRLKDHLERKTLDLTNTRFVTLDEADQMLDMGFAEDMSAILGECTHASRQTCLFSATLPSWVRRVAPKYMRQSPQLVDLVGDSDGKASAQVRHIAIPAPGPVRERVSTINDVISMYAGQTGRSIVFCTTKAECDELTTSEALRFEAKALHGDVPQAVREKVTAAFRNGRFRVLVATDVAARGLDMIVDLVMQNRPPVRKSGTVDTETYVHRSGRTGRAGRKGICVTLFGPRERHFLEAIEHNSKNTFEWLSAPSPRTLLATAADTATADAAAVSTEVLPFFEKAAKELLSLKKEDAVAAVASALALATGTSSPPTERSLLTHLEGYTTLRAMMRQQVNGPSYIWGALRRVLPDGACEGTDGVRAMRLTDDGFGAVFDVKQDLMGELKEYLEDEQNDWLFLCDELPALKQNDFGKGGGRFGVDWSGGKGGGKGGGKAGGRGGGKGGGFKGGGKGGAGGGRSGGRSSPFSRGGRGW